MKTGRKPQPTHLKLVKGVAKARIAKDEPKAPAGMPTAPDRFTSPAAKAAWLRFGSVLDSMGVLAKTDGAALQRLAEVYAQVSQLQQHIANHGHTYLGGVETDSKGQPIPGTGLTKARPEVGMLADADRRLRAYLTDFGLTPSARTRVKSAEPSVDKGEFD